LENNTFGGTPEQSEKPSKKEYSSPQLTHYGSVVKLTQGGSFTGNDGNTKCTGNAGSTTECTS